MEMDYWAPADRHPTSLRWQVSDGGAYENVPLLSFLQRQVSKIVLFFNQHLPLQPSNKFNVETDEPNEKQITNDFSCFFGVFPDKADYEYAYERNQVFPRDDYVSVVKALQAAQSKGNGIVATFNLTTVANEWWGIPAGFTAEVTFVMLGRAHIWESQLSSEMRALVTPTSPEAAADYSEVIDTGMSRLLLY
jgi:hypothetical protein